MTVPAGERPSIPCTVCGELPASTEGACRICLEPRRRARARLLPRNRLLSCGLLPLLFAGSCTALLPLGMKLADPMTHRSVDSFPDLPFPVAVLTGDEARVHWLTGARDVPALSAGSSYLIPAGKEAEVEAKLNAGLPPSAEGGWALDVRRLAPDRQHIDLVWINDGYAGGAYEATRTSVSPRYRKLTGPGFAFVFGGIALLINAAIWLAILSGVRRLRRRFLIRLP